MIGEGSVECNGYGLRAYSWRERKYSRRACLGSAHTVSAGRWMMDCMLREGLDVVRGDVQTRLFGGTEEEVGRLVRFSDVAMIFCRLMNATETGGDDFEVANGRRRCRAGVLHESEVL